MNNTTQNRISTTVFVLASNETDSLRQLVSILKKDGLDDIEKIVIVLKSESCPSFFETEKLCNEPGNEKIEMYVQKAPNAVLCLAELPPMVKSSHFVIMAADLEMDPCNIKDFTEKAKQHPQRIICAAKWLNGSEVEGYGRIHELGSRAMNTFISILFKKNVKDPFSIFQIYPTAVYHRMKFDDPENFLYEYTLKPLKYGVEYEEIPTVYKKRQEGKSNFNVTTILKVAIKFCLTALRIRFLPMR